MMKKWLILLAVPAMAICNQGEFLIDVEQENVLTNLALDPFAEDFASQELTIFELDEKDVCMTFWSDEILAKDLNDNFSFEDPLSGDFVPSPEHVPSPQSCTFDIKNLQP